MRKLKRITSILLILIYAFALTNTSAYAVPPSNPHIESGTAAEGGNFFEFDASYLGESVWRDLKTPPHWVVETGEVAYCLDHMADCPHNVAYGEFDPLAIYSEETYLGLLAILEHSYPYRNAGLTDQQIRYATANAIRSWLRESAGIGYDFMLPANEAVRPKNSAAQSTYNFYLQLLDKARNGSVITHYVKTSPEVIEMHVDGNVLIGQATIECGVLKGGYEINEEALPEGMSITGYTGEDGDTLSISAPISMMGESISISDVFVGYDNRCAANVYWLDDSGGSQSVAVPVVDRVVSVATGSLSFKSDASTVTITKHGETDGVLLKGAIFGIYDASNDSLIEQLTTANSGQVISNNLMIGDYYIKEITSPEGYILSEETYPFSIADTNQNIEMSVYNDPIKGKVSILKTGEQDNPLQEVLFCIYDTADNLIQEVITDVNGMAISNYLAYGDYYLKEVSAPEGYILIDEKISFSITENEDIVELTISNTLIRGKVQVIKEDEEGNPLEGVVFGVYDMDDTPIEELTTDSEGIAISSDLIYGEYYLQETEALEGYVLNEEPFSFSIDEGGEIVEFEVINERIYGYVEIIKTDSDNETLLEGVVFELYDSQDELIETLMTDSNGYVISGYLKYGDYYIKEAGVPEGYVLNGELYSFSILNDEETITLNIANYPIKGKVEAIKTDSETGEKLSNAVFGIYDEDNNLIQELTSDEDGYAISPFLLCGDYYLMEITAPEGYILSDKVYPFNITMNNQIVSFDITNEIIKGRVEIIKTEPISGNSLDGAKFGIYNNGILVEELVTDENGSVISSDLNYGMYYIKEMDAPEGYVPNDELYHFSINKDKETVTLNITNDPIKGKMEVVKTDTRIGDNLSGAVFGIYDYDNNLIQELKTNEDGYMISSPLLYGDYYLKEITAPEGYILNDEVYPFSIAMNNQIVHLDISNVIIKGRVEIIKTEPINGDPLEGVSFGVYDKNDNLIEEITTDENEIALSSDLVYGEYFIQEIETLDGYISDDTKYQIVISEDGQMVELNIQNTPVSGSVEVFFRHIDYGNELHDSYVYSDWAGMPYMNWVESKGLVDKGIDGFTFVKSDYPTSNVLIGGKLIITYWYDDEIVEGGWSEVAIPKTGQKYPKAKYLVGIFCFIIAFLIMGVSYNSVKRGKKK